MFVHQVEPVSCSAAIYHTSSKEIVFRFGMDKKKKNNKNNNLKTKR